MRILIGNDVDDSLLLKKDISAWAQRIFWFAEDNDLIVLMRPPDERFVRYVTSLTGVDPASLKVHVVPPGRFDRRLLDPQCLTDEEFLRNVSKDLDGVSRIFALWPSPQVSHFASTLGLLDLWPGADFFSQSGGELVNNNANFRAFAASCGVRTARGEVCRTVDDAVAAMNRLLGGETSALMVKQAHAGAGAGNQIVTRDEDLETDHAGGRHFHVLGPGPDGVRAYWAERWEWASANGRYAVVIEEFQRRARSVYAEFHCDDSGVRLMEVGTLIFEKRVLTQELLPFRDLTEDVRARLVTSAARLAEFYRTMGYRGHLSADAVVTEDGEVTFTEVNAQVTGSTHLYSVIAHRIVDTSCDPERSVVQCLSPPHWAMADLDEFLNGADEVGCLYDEDSRKGVIAVMPVIPDAGKGALLYCIVFDTEDERQVMFQKLDERLRTDA